MDMMRSEGVEFRRGSAGGGNQLRQPYLKGLIPEGYYKEFPETDHIHFYGFYIGNFPDLKEGEIEEICTIFNSV
jgi:CDP-6-deoxy-D-xylo-4-hexulose-3-dehydrase